MTRPEPSAAFRACLAITAVGYICAAAGATRADANIWLDGISPALMTLAAIAWACAALLPWRLRPALIGTILACAAPLHRLGITLLELVRPVTTQPNITLRGGVWLIITSITAGLWLHVIIPVSAFHGGVAAPPAVDNDQGAQAA